jgi:hypothetical protein
VKGKGSGWQGQGRGEQDLLAGGDKPVGLLVTPAEILVSDSSGAIVRGERTASALHGLLDRTGIKGGELQVEIEPDVPYGLAAELLRAVHARQPAPLLRFSRSR